MEDREVFISELTAGGGEVDVNVDRCCVLEDDVVATGHGYELIDGIAQLSRQAEERRLLARSGLRRWERH